MERHTDHLPDRKGFEDLEKEKATLIEETRIMALLEDASRNASEEECVELRETQKRDPKNYSGTIGGHQIHVKWSVDPDIQNGYSDWLFSIDGTEVLDTNYLGNPHVRDGWKDFLIKKVGLSNGLMINPDDSYPRDPRLSYPS